MGAMESTASRTPRRLEGRTAGDESRARPWNVIRAAASELPSRVGERDAVRVAHEKPKSDGRAQGLDLGNREALPPMSVGMAPRAPGPVIMKQIRMKALLGPRGGQPLHRGFWEEVKDSVGKGLSIRG